MPPAKTYSYDEEEYRCPLHPSVDLTEHVKFEVQTQYTAVLGIERVERTKRGTKPGATDFLVLVPCNGDSSDDKPHRQPVEGTVTVT